MSDIRTLSFPFGRDVDTLVLCSNEDHRKAAIKELAMKARYETIQSALCGSRFNKIIVLSPPNDKWNEAEETMIREYLPTKLNVGGSLIVL